MSTDYAPAAWLGSSAIHYGGWGNVPFAPRWIIVHGTAGDMSLASVAATFAARTSSTHYAIDEAGHVGQYVPESAPAWGNGPITGPAGVAVAGAGNAHDTWWDAAPDGNPNTVTISIEHCKPDSQNSTLLTAAQKAASFALIKHLCAAHGIPPHVYSVASPAQLAQGGITGHFSMDPLNRAHCPGAYPWAELAAYLGGNMAGLPDGWTDDGTTLTAPNGVAVVTAKRDHILAAPDWPAALVPVAPSTGINGAGDTAQDFALRLVWTKASGAVSEVAGVAVDTEAVARLTAQVQDLTAQLAAAGTSGSVEAIAALRTLKAALAQF